MKKLYQKPEIQVVRINHSVQLMGASGDLPSKYISIKDVKGSAGFTLGDGSDGGGRSRGWDDWDEEEW